MAQPIKSSLMAIWLFQSSGFTLIHLAITGQWKMLISAEFSSELALKNCEENLNVSMVMLYGDPELASLYILSNIYSLRVIR